MTGSNSRSRLSASRAAVLCLAAVLAVPWLALWPEASAQQAGGDSPRHGNSLDFRWLTEGGAPVTAPSDPMFGGADSATTGTPFDASPGSGPLGRTEFRLLNPEEVRQGGRAAAPAISVTEPSNLSLRLAVPTAGTETTADAAESPAALPAPPTGTTDVAAPRTPSDGSPPLVPAQGVGENAGDGPQGPETPDLQDQARAPETRIPDAASAERGRPDADATPGRWQADPDMTAGTSAVEASDTVADGVTPAAGNRRQSRPTGPRTRLTLGSDSGLRADLTGETTAPEIDSAADGSVEDSDTGNMATGAPVPIVRASDRPQPESGPDSGPNGSAARTDEAEAPTDRRTDAHAARRGATGPDPSGRDGLAASATMATETPDAATAPQAEGTKARAHVAAPIGIVSDARGGDTPRQPTGLPPAPRQSARVAAPALDGPGPAPDLAATGAVDSAAGGTVEPDSPGSLSFGRAVPTKEALGELPAPVLAAASTRGIDDPRLSPDGSGTPGVIASEDAGAGRPDVSRAAGPVPEPRLDLQPGTVTSEPALLAPAPVSDRHLLQAQATPGAAPTPLFGRMDEEAGRDSGRRDPVVEVDELDAVDIGSVGLLDESKGGLTADLWNGAQRGPVEAMLTRLPVASTSATVQELMRLLLLTISAAPEPATGRKADPTRYVAMRIARLIDMGALEQAYDLARLLPGRLEDPNLDRLRIQAGLLAGRLEDACRDADRALRLYTDVFFARVQVFCETRRGETEKAFLGLSLLRETGDADPLFAGLIEKLLGGAQSDAPDPEALGPLMMRLYLDAGRPYPPAVASSGSFGYQRLFLDNQLNGQETRLLVAETLVAAGVVPSDRLRVIYNDMSFSPEELSAATGGTGPASGPRARAAVHKAATNAGAPAQKAALVQRNLDLASSTENYQALMLANAPIVRLLRPGESLAWFADEAGRLLIYSGRRDPAMPWLALQTARPAAGVPTAADSESEMPAWLLARLAGIRDSLAGWSPERLRTWAERQKRIGTPESQRRLTLGMTLLRAFGEPVDWPSQPLRDTLTRQAGNDATSPQALALRSGSAAVQKQVGLAVLYAILALGDRGPSQTDVVVLDQIIRSLNYIGLDGIARRMAVEAAVVWTR